MRWLPISLLASALLPLGPALAADGPAQSASPAPAERRLSEAEVEKILDEAARRREAAPLAVEPIDPDEGKVGLPVHGEVGFAIGTGGYRSAYGTAVVPLANDGFAAFSFETNRFRPRDFRYYDDYAR
jgi:hypothetical protein